MRLLALDPGEKTGYSIFEGKTLIAAGTVKFDTISVFIDRLIREEKCDEVVIEEPGTRGWNDRPGMGTLNKRVGYLWGFMEASYVPVRLVSVSTWKGNKPKEITRRDMGLIYGVRLSEIYGAKCLDLDQNAYDAIGIGHWWLGTGSLLKLGKSKGKPA